MSAIITKGFIIKKQNYVDYDLIVTILTIDGKISFLARGIRKIASKNRYSLQLGNFVEVEIFKARLNNKLSKLKKAVSIKTFDLKIVNLATSMLIILKIINKIEHPHQYFYQTLLQSLDYFSKYDQQIKTYFKFLNLKQHGLSPVMDKCYQCLSYENIIHFDWEKGGFICNLHTDNKTKLIKLKAYQKLEKGLCFYIKVDNDINFIIGKEIDYYAQKTLY